MPVDLWNALAAIEGDDGQLKTAAKKLAHEPEMGHMDAGGTASGLGQSTGRGPMDAKALLDERALEAAGSELEGRTFQDPRERSGARNLANRAGAGPTSPTDSARPVTKPSNVHLPKTGPATHRVDSLGGKKAASEKKAGIGKMVGDYKSYGHGMKGLKRVGAGLRGVAKENPGAVRAAKMTGAGAAVGGAGFVAGRKSKKQASLTLTAFAGLLGAGEPGMKVASEHYGEREVISRLIQARDAQSTGMKLACGMFKAAAAENQGK